MKHTLLFSFTVCLIAHPCSAQMQATCMLFDAGFFTNSWGGAVETPDGGAVVCGGYDPNNSGNTDIVLTKVDASGALQWMKTYGTGPTTSETGMAIINTSDGGLAVAGTEYLGRGYLMKLDADGVPQWTRTYAYPDDVMQMAENALVQLGDGGFALHWRTRFGLEGWLMLRTDASGNVLWSDELNYSGVPMDVAALPNGDLIFNGQNGSQGVPQLVLRKDGLTGVTEWMHWYMPEANGNLDLHGLVVGPDSAIVVGGTAHHIDYHDVFAMAISADGTPLWSTRIGGVMIESARDIAWDPNEGYVLAGEIRDTVMPFNPLGGFVARLDANGQRVWSKFVTHPDAIFFRPWRCATASDGGVLLTGEAGTPTYYPQPFTKLDVDGNACPHCPNEDVGTATAMDITIAPEQGHAFAGPWATGADFSFTVSDITSIVEPIACGTTGVEEPPSGPNVTVAPNPFVDRVVITLDRATINGQTWIEMRDVLGRLVHRQRLTGNSTVIQRAALAPGRYAYHITDASGSLAAGVVQVADR